MAIVQGTIVGTGQAIQVELPTARAPELAAFTEIADDDIIVGWDASDNKTKKMTTAQLRAKFNGDAIPETPVLSGADMEIPIPAELVGQKKIDIPALAGYTFSLIRRGPGRLATAEYNILSTGGFELAKEGDKFFSGDLFFAHIYELEGGTIPDPGGGGGNTPPSLITGIKTVSINTTLVAADIGKLINVAGNNVKVVLTLPDLTAIPENSVIPIETMVNNQFQTTIATQSGQFIYFRGTSSLKVYMGRGEVLWVTNGADGWYVINSYGNYLDVGQPIMGYSTMLNTLPAEGQLVNRDSYPRLWEYAQSAGAALVEDSLWTSAPFIYGGCFGTGDGTTTFRVPDLRGFFPRFLDRGRGMDTDGRAYNNPGGGQDDQNKAHNHTSGPYNRVLKEDGTWTVIEWDNTPSQPNLGFSGEMQSSGGSEARPKNIGFIGLIKV